MHIVINKSRPKNSRLTYQSILLMEPYREDGKVKKRTVANLTKCNLKEIEAIRIALKHKGDLAVLGSLKEDLTIEEGKSVGAVYVAYEVAKRIGIEEALGKVSFLTLSYLKHLSFSHNLLYKVFSLSN